jgi:hypothetical protein
MKVVVNVPKAADIEKVNHFFSVFRFPHISICQREEKAQVQVEGEYCIDVLNGEDDLKAKDIETMFDQGACSVMIFNENAKDLDEPKVIFATDHSEQANANLETFKLLKPAGFAGATVISEANTSSSEMINHEINVRFLERTKTAVQSTQANLIIANFDLRNLGRKSAQFTNILKLVLQNRCHVLILKSY